MTLSKHDTPLSRYQKLISISRDLASTLDLDILLNHIVEAAAELSQAEAASILLYDQRSGKLRFQVATNLKEPVMRGLVIPVDESIAGWIVRNRQALIIDDAQHDNRHFNEINQITDMTTKSILGVPLIAQNRINGVLEAINKQAGKFTAEDQDILMTLGAQAAVAIENSRLFHQSDLIAEFVHELRTPLSALMTATDLINHPRIPEEKRGEIVKRIHTETHRLSDMADDFLNIARLESGRIQFRRHAFDLKAVLEEIAQLVENLAAKNDLGFSSKIAEDIPEFDGDRDKIKQAIFNLLSNAIKYTPSGGEIALEAKTLPDEISIQVKDTGIGIPEQHLENIFKKFYRVPGAEKHATGTGLGLSIVEKIITGHRGSIEVESEVEAGTTFSVHLPKTTIRG